MVVDSVCRHTSTELGLQQNRIALWRAPGTVYACLYRKLSVLPAKTSSDPQAAASIVIGDQLGIRKFVNGRKRPWAHNA